MFGQSNKVILLHVSFISEALMHSVIAWSVRLSRATYLSTDSFPESIWASYGNRQNFRTTYRQFTIYFRLLCFSVFNFDLIFFWIRSILICWNILLLWGTTHFPGVRRCDQTLSRIECLCSPTGLLLNITSHLVVLYWLIPNSHPPWFFQISYFACLEPNIRRIPRDWYPFGKLNRLF